VKLLCGADLLESFAVPGIWKPEHVIYTHCTVKMNVFVTLSEFKRILHVLVN